MSAHHCHTRSAFDPKLQAVKGLCNLILRYDFSVSNKQPINKNEFSKEKAELKEWAKQNELDWSEIVKEAKIHAYGNR